jgi:tellurite resistance protein
MFKRIFGSAPEHQQVAELHDQAFDAAAASGDTETVRRIVARVEALPPDRARLVASAAYTLARAANADLDISDDETAVIEDALRKSGGLDEATAVLVAEMAKLQARTVGGTEDYVVTREFAKLATVEQRIDVLRACFVVAAANGSISAEESAEVNEIAKELQLDAYTLNRIRDEFHELLSSVQAVRKVAEGR